MPRAPRDTDQLLDDAGRGDAAARSRLLASHRAPLRRLVAVHMDRRIAARVDPSDVVQEVLAQAAQHLSDYLRRRPLPFFPWLRQMALDRLIDLYRRHVLAGRRSVTREEMNLPLLPDESALLLAARLFAPDGDPEVHYEREETCARVRRALGRLSERDRDVLVMRHLEGLSSREIAAALGITEGAVNVRHLRALRRLGALLGKDTAGGAS